MHGVTQHDRDIGSMCIKGNLDITSSVDAILGRDEDTAMQERAASVPPATPKDGDTQRMDE